MLSSTVMLALKRVQVNAPHSFQSIEWTLEQWDDKTMRVLAAASAVAELKVARIQSVVDSIRRVTAGPQDEENFPLHRRIAASVERMHWARATAINVSNRNHAVAIPSDTAPSRKGDAIVCR